MTALTICGRPGFDPWVGKTPWRRKWQPTPVFLPGESHGRRSLTGYSPWGRKSETWQNNWTSLQPPYAATVKPKRRRSVTAAASYPFYLPWSDGTGCRDFRFLILRFKPALSLSSFTFIRRLFRSSLLSPIRIGISEAVGISPGKLDSSL